MQENQYGAEVLYKDFDNKGTHASDIHERSDIRLAKAIRKQKRTVKQNQNVTPIRKVK